MAVRYPLIVDTTDNNKIKELPSGDSLNLSGNNIVNVVDVTASGTLTVQNLTVESTTFTVDGNSLNAVAFTGSYTDLSNTPTLFDGVYSSLTGKPTIPANIEDLANVGSTSPANGEILIYDSTLGRYEPGTINASFDAQFQDQNIDNLNNVVFTGDKTNDVLKFVDGIWKNERVDFDELTGTLNVVQQGDTLTGSLVGDVTGSVLADDSTLLVDGVNGSIPAANLTGALPAIDGSALTGVTGGQNLIKAYGHVDVSSPITASADYNVASVTSSATGKYDVTFTTALPNANYVVLLSVQTNVSSNNYTVQYYNRTTTGFQVQKFLNGSLDGGASGNFSFVIIQT